MRARFISVALPTGGGKLENGSSGDLAVTDERKAAQAVARASFAKIGSQHTELMKPYGIPIERRILQSFKTIALSAASHENLGTPNWKERARIWHIGGVNEAAKNIPGSRPGPGLGFGAIFVITIAVATAAVAALEASSNEKKWGPCMRELAGDLKKLNLAGLIRSRLRKKLTAQDGLKLVDPTNGISPDGSVKKGNFKALLKADIQRVQIRECEERGTFCLEVVIRARLFDSGAKEPVYDTTFHYSNLTGPPILGELHHTGSNNDLKFSSRRFLYRMVAPGFFSNYVMKIYPPSLIVSPQSPCRWLKAWCGEGGRKLFRDELSKALDILVDHILLKAEAAGTVK